MKTSKMPVNTNWSNHHPGRRNMLFMVPMILAGCYNPPVENLAVWSEFLSTDQVRAHLDTLAGYGADLYLAIHPEDLNDQLRDLLNDASTAEVNVRAWLQLPDEGIWVNEDNAGAFTDFVREFLNWAEANEVPIEWIIFDLEPSLEYLESLQEAAQGEGVPAMIDLLYQHRNPEAFLAAQQMLAQLVDELHGRGVQVMAVVFPWIIDDLQDGDADLQDMWDTPLQGIAWDQVSIMAYRPIFSELLGIPISPAYIARYSESLNSWYPQGAQVALGPVSNIGVGNPPGYTDPWPLVLDVSAARSAGINDLSIFSLDGMIAEGGPEGWLAAITGPTLRYSYPDFIIDVLQEATIGFDRSIEAEE